MTITEQINAAIEELKATDIEGCITGSTMTRLNFDEWAEKPDIDVFVYRKAGLLYAADLLMMKLGYEPLSEGEAWKLERVRSGDYDQKNNKLATLKFKRGDVIVNVTYKYGKSNMFAVLSSFDMSIIMVGYDIQRNILLDLRVGWDGMVPEDPNGMWSKSIWTAVPNPLRKQDTDMYGTEMWVRQFNRVIKYWDRGFDTRPMARFYVKAINRVLEKGQLFNTDRSAEAYAAFESTYVPLRDRMQAWLEEKED